MTASCLRFIYNGAYHNSSFPILCFRLESPVFGTFRYFTAFAAMAVAFAVALVRAVCALALAAGVLAFCTLS